MNSVMDYIMTGLFVLFMLFIFGGYHQNKFNERENQRKKQEEKEKREQEEGKE
ncbi:MAG: hypothetical protein ABFR02_06235 [Campylobacterota bacterium]